MIQITKEQFEEAGVRGMFQWVGLITGQSRHGMNFVGSDDSLLEYVHAITRKSYLPSKESMKEFLKETEDKNLEELWNNTKVKLLKIIKQQNYEKSKILT